MFLTNFGSQQMCFAEFFFVLSILLQFRLFFFFLLQIVFEFVHQHFMGNNLLEYFNCCICVVKFVAAKAMILLQECLLFFAFVVFF
jgi:hypothetical protein